MQPKRIILPSPFAASRQLSNGCEVAFDVADATKSPFDDASVDLVFGSPPYCDARTYGIGAQRGCREWIDFMLTVTREAVRVSRGLVLWVVAGVTRDSCYWPACEGLLYEWWRNGGQCWRPAYWHRIGIPGSGGPQWLRANIEYVLAFKGTRGPIPWADNVAMGRPPKGPPGGPMSNRTKSGIRLDRASQPDRYQSPEKANPGNLISAPEEDATSSLVNTGVSGAGNDGDAELHENEAPFPEALAEFFIRSFCPPGGWVYDPFNGSGTTAITAGYFGRNGVGADLRENQIALSLKRLDRRIAEGVDTAAPLFTAPAAPRADALLFAQGDS